MWDLIYLMRFGFQLERRFSTSSGAPTVTPPIWTKFRQRKCPKIEMTVWVNCIEQFSTSDFHTFSRPCAMKGSKKIARLLGKGGLPWELILVDWELEVGSRSELGDAMMINISISRCRQVNGTCWVQKGWELNSKFRSWRIDSENRKEVRHVF